MTETKVARLESRRVPVRLLAAALALVLLLGGTGGLFLWRRHADTAAVVNGERITRAQLFDAMYARVGQEVLDEIIGTMLVAQAARQMEVTVNDAELEKYMQDLEARFGGPEALDAALSYYGLTRAAVEKDIRSHLLAQAAVLKDVHFSEFELREFFEQNRLSFGTPERVKASHILLGTEAEAAEILARLRAGDNFAALAAEFSVDTVSAMNGGDLGFFTWQDMMPEFAEAAFALEEGELSGIVASFYGYHLILLTGREPATDPDYEDVREQVLEAIRHARAEELLPEWMWMLRLAATIEYRLPTGR